MKGKHSNSKAAPLNYFVIISGPFLPWKSVQNETKGQNGMREVSARKKEGVF